jgi:hypothetical protein
MSKGLNLGFLPGVRQAAFPTGSKPADPTARSKVPHPTATANPNSFRKMRAYCGG